MIACYGAVGGGEWVNDLGAEIQVWVLFDVQVLFEEIRYVLISECPH